MKKIKKIKHRVAALAISFFLTLGLAAPAFNITVKAEALEVENSACTVADMIFSYCASGGVAIVNETVIDEVYNVLGSSFGTLQTFVDNGLLTYSNGQYVDTGLSTNIQSAITNVSSLDIGALFNQTAQQNPAGVALSGSGTLAGIAGSVATTGVLPLVAGVAVTGYCGFQIGTIINNMVSEYGENINKGLYLDALESVKNSIPAGTVCATGKNDYGVYIINGATGISCAVNVNGSIQLAMVNPDSAQTYMKYTIRSYDGGIKNSQVSCNQWDSKRLAGSGSITSYNVTYFFESLADLNNAITSWENEDPYKTGNISPDVIGNTGNLTGNYNDGVYTVPDAQPQVDPETQSINPSGMTFEDWMQLVNAALANNINTDPDANKDLFDDIMDKIRIDTPTPAPSPDPDPDPNPDPDPVPNPNPESVPAPDVNPYPDTYPVADPETVPDNKPQPEYTEKATENETDITEGDPYTTPNLLNKFPFCIPRDILKVFKKLDSGERQAPHIQWRFNPNNMIDYTFDIDFSTWDDVASLLRILELLGFIIALGIATRNLILS